jgi:hypothetical protein
MITTALRILKYNPSLKQINIRWAKEQCPNHLKQEGCYDVVDGSDGRPDALMVVEKGIPFLGVPFFRRYRHRIEKGGGREQRYIRLVS